MENICDFTRNNQPIRSTYADINNTYSATGLSDINPFDGLRVFDDCEDEVGDGFVRSIMAQRGEIYAILINGFDDQIAMKNLNLNFSATDQRVIGMPFSIDTILILPEELDSLEVGCPIEAVAVLSPEDVVIDSQKWLVNGDSISNQETLSFTILEEGILTIETQINASGCDASFSLSENVFPTREIEIPNIFSPNGDGRNDFFRPLISAKAAIIDMKIYNRWGQKVYDNDSNDQGWNGQLNSSNMPTDVYVYQVIIEQPNGQRIMKEGDVTLIR